MWSRMLSSTEQNTNYRNIISSEPRCTQPKQRLLYEKQSALNYVLQLIQYEKKLVRIKDMENYSQQNEFGISQLK